MDEGTAAQFAAPLAVPVLTPLRLVFMALLAVAGGFALSLALGSSPASAAESDDPHAGPVTTGTIGGVVDAVTHIVQISHATPAAAIAAPATQAVDAVVAATPLAPVTGTQPVTSVVTPVAGVVDRAIAAAVAPLVAPLVDTTTTIGSALALAPAEPTTSRPADATVTTAASAARGAVAITGAATGVLAHLVTANLTPDAAGLSGSGPGGIALALGFGAALLLPLVALRRRADSDAMPASPVFDTDSSPD